MILHMENKPLEYYIPKAWVITLFVFYSVIILAGGTVLLYIFNKLGESCTYEKIRMYTFFVSILSSAMLTAVRYSQRLYKACIDGRVFFTGENKAIVIGNIMYFLFRPIYAVAFAVIFVVCLLGGLLFIMNGMDFVINERIVYLAAIISAFIGYSIGNVLDSFEYISKDKLNKII